MTEDEETDLIWSELTAPAVAAFTERMHELTGLVHYTSFSALEGILDKEEIWFSPAMAMNDFEEVVRGKRLLEEFSSKDGPLEKVISDIFQVDGALGKLLNDAYVANKEGDLFDTFVSCWSTSEIGSRQHDNLAMWRGYAAEGNGAAIVIDPTALGLDSPFQSEIIACPVYYETEDQFAERANRTLAHFLRNLQNLNPELVKKHSDYAANAFSEICFHLAITHKHPGFVQEREWRFVWRRHKDVDGRLSSYVQSRVGARGLYEYFCFPIRTDPQVSPAELKIQNIIREVMIGPTEDAYLKKLAVDNLLRSKGFDLERTKVTISDIPFRPS